MRVAHLTIQARVNTEKQHCLQLDLLTLRFLALGGIQPSGTVASMEGYVTLTRGKHLAKKAFTCRRNNEMEMQYQ